jgi:pilus assembly protein CpaB
MVPLLAIAFVVAIISTGVFYGLFAGKLRSSSEIPGHAIVVAARDLDRGAVLQASDLRVSEVHGVLGGSFSKPEEATGATLLTAIKANEPVLEERVVARISDASIAATVPTGMRAVSIHVFQSESLLNLLRPGSRVDVQAVSDRNGTVELRTVLENVKVLGVNSPDANGNRPPGAVVTVLTRALDTDMLALADAGTRVRVTLRNPMDEGTTPRRSIALAALFSGIPQREADQPVAALSTDTPAWDHPIQLHVQVLSASDAAIEELRVRSAETGSDASWRAAAFHSSDEAVKLIDALAQSHELEIVSSERLMAGIGRPISYHAGSKPYPLRVRFSPQWLGAGKLSLRVEPRMGSAPSSQAETQFTDASSFLLESRANDPAWQDTVERLFPGRSWEHHHLVVFVSARAIQQTSPVALARTGRGR